MADLEVRDTPMFREIPNTTPALSDVQAALYWLGAVIGGRLAFFGKGSQVWLWLLPLAVLLLPGVLKQSIRGEDQPAQTRATFNRPQMWIFGSFGAVLVGKGLATHYWPTLVFGVAYVCLAFLSPRIGKQLRAQENNGPMISTPNILRFAHEDKEFCAESEPLKAKT